MTSVIDRWQSLPVLRKLYLMALVVASVSPFLPWFSDNSQFVSGDFYLGLVGPTSFIGLSIFVLSVLALIQEIFVIVKGRLLFGEMVASWLYNGTGLINLYLLGLSASVFSHPSVGNNILAKHMVWGFYVGMGTYIVLIVGILLHKQGNTTSKRSGAKMNTKQARDHRSIEPKSAPAPMPTAPVNEQGDIRVLKIEDVVPKSVEVDQRFRNQWSKQRALETRVVKSEDENIF